MFDYRKYATLLGEMESKNDYKKINPIGAIGKYQFMPATLNGLKNLYNLEDWKNPQHFADSPYLQEIYFFHLVNDIQAFILRENLNRFNGVAVRGSIRFPGITAKLNIYGMLAAAHLAGVGNLKRYLLEGHDPNDGKTSLTDYAAYFSYHLNDLFNPAFLILAFIPALVLYYS